MERAKRSTRNQNPIYTSPKLLPTKNRVVRGRKRNTETFTSSQHTADFRGKRQQTTAQSHRQSKKRRISRNNRASDDLANASTEVPESFIPTDKIKQEPTEDAEKSSIQEAAMSKCVSQDANADPNRTKHEVITSSDDSEDESMCIDENAEPGDMSPNEAGDKTLTSPVKGPLSDTSSITSIDSAEESETSERLEPISDDEDEMETNSCVDLISPISSSSESSSDVDIPSRAPARRAKRVRTPPARNFAVNAYDTTSDDSSSSDALGEKARKKKKCRVRVVPEIIEYYKMLENKSMEVEKTAGRGTKRKIRLS